MLNIDKEEFKQILENILSKKTRKELTDYITELQAKYSLLECKYLSWEAEGSVCNGGHGTGFCRCVEHVAGQVCPYKVMK